ncbi:MAG: type II secretion system GspH family protein, partial [Holosporaceae bacterium]|nr:type II secretion system GspH family protein [Holosporaceae bacterium]
MLMKELPFLIKFNGMYSGEANTQSTCGGSLLLEIAVVLSIIGLVGGFLVTKIITAHRALRAQMTRNNMETVVVAVASFLANNNRLPMPAADATGLEVDASNDNLSDYTGRVPYEVLGLTEKDVIDGMGRPLIYTVEPFLTQQFNALHKNDAENNGGIGRQDYFCNDIYVPKIIFDQQMPL